MPALCRAIASARQDDWVGQEIVHVGSALEYGDIKGDLAEHSAPNPTTLYGRSKLAGTLQLRRACQRLGLRGLTARLFTVYGPGEHPGRLLPSLIAAAESGGPLELTSGLQRRDFTYVEDVADGLLRLGLARTAPGDVVNLATGKLSTVREFVQVGAGVLSISDAQLRFGALPGRPEEMAHDAVRTTHLEALTSWTPPTSIADGIRMTAEHRKRGL
ncbi:MAG: NAD-dependent epimerase/dehydratase family protein [Acidobacteria bacterium]|nr:NAD-dependent epimerase/dehydratase family protein [Acidobacteriota bacterium]